MTLFAKDITSTCFCRISSSILLHMGVISLPDATSCDKDVLSLLILDKVEIKKPYKKFNVAIM